LNLHKRCRNCNAYFPSKPMSLELYCDKKACQEHWYHTIEIIKSMRGIYMNYFDIYDLDRPITSRNGKSLGYEHVCRECGKPLKNKDGKYSSHRRYCSEHDGFELFEKYNWSAVSKNYARKIRDENHEYIFEKIIEKYGLNYFNLEEMNNFTVCEDCKKLCQIYELSYYKDKFKDFPILNVHHIKPVHTLTEENLSLIWDFNNLIVLCPECHKKQPHFLKNKKKDPFLQFKKITSFL